MSYLDFQEMQDWGRVLQNQHTDDEGETHNVVGPTAAAQQTQHPVQAQEFKNQTSFC